MQKMLHGIGCTRNKLLWGRAQGDTWVLILLPLGVNFTGSILDILNLAINVRWVTNYSGVNTPPSYWDFLSMLLGSCKGRLYVLSHRCCDAKSHLLRVLCVCIFLYFIIASDSEQVEWNFREISLREHRKIREGSASAGGSGVDPFRKRERCMQRKGKARKKNYEGVEKDENEMKTTWEKNIWIHKKERLRIRKRKITYYCCASKLKDKQSMVLRLE